MVIPPPVPVTLSTRTKVRKEKELRCGSRLKKFKPNQVRKIGEEVLVLNFLDVPLKQKQKTWTFNILTIL